MMIDWKPLAELIGKYDRYVLTSHVRPDCDALGSELGMANVLRSFGKQVRIVNADEVPPHLKFIDPDQTIEVLGQSAELPDLADTEVVIVLDTSAWQQLGAMAEVIDQLPAARVVIDHHLSSDDLGATEFKDVKAAATGCLVVEAAEAMGVLLSKDAASALFTAVATDTGWYRFQSVGARELRVAAKLVEAGASPHQLYASLYEQSTLSRVHLLGLLLQRTTFEVEGRLGYTYVDQADFAQLGARPSDTEDAVNFVLTVRGSEVALIFVELEDGSCKVSFRSRSQFDVRLIAEQFGGGGHRAAAGARLNAPREEATALVLDAVRKAMR